MNDEILYFINGLSMNVNFPGNQRGISQQTCNGIYYVICIYLIKYKGQEHKHFSHHVFWYFLSKDFDRRFFYQGKCSLVESFLSQDSLIVFQGWNQTTTFIEQTGQNTPGFFVRQQSGRPLTEGKVPERHGEVSDQILAAA